MVKRRPSLEPYRQKRDFTKTREPPPDARTADVEGRRFVVQHHWATREHYDFRIELDGVLKSWAVTKSPSLDPKVRRLAVRTEDHPIDYASFEGTIPKGEYGGGTVMVWDEGSWEPAQPDPLAALDKGELKMVLHGKRMVGRYVLVRLKPEGKRENWLLIKERDEYAEEGDAADLGERYVKSAKTGRTRGQIERGAPEGDPPTEQAPQKHEPPRTAIPLPKSKPGDARHLPRFRKPMLCEPHEEPPAGDGWLHEVKYDGYRVQAAVAGSAVKLYSREGLDWTHRFGRVAPALAALNLPPCLIDGEMVVFDENGVSRFSRLVDLLDTGAPEITYVAFDLLSLDGRSLTDLPILERKAQLADLLEHADGQRIRIASWIEGDGAKVFRHAIEGGAEGIVSKRIDSLWRSGRGRDWWKIKGDTRDDVVVVGYMPSEKRPFASLCVAFETKDGLAYAGNVGTGYTDKILREAMAKLKPLERKSPPAGLTFPEKPPRQAVWVDPKLRCEVAYTERTPQGALRHPRFLGFREDRTKDTPVKPTKTMAARKAAPAKRSAAPDVSAPLSGPPAMMKRISHPERVVYPEAGVTKADVAAYYIAVADRMLPYLTDRPVSFVRAPEGLGGERFFQRHALPGMEKGIASVPDPVGGDSVMVIENVDGLVTAAQFGVVEIHGWGAKFPDIDKVERIVFDLDPDEAVSFDEVRSAAFLLRDLLQAAGMKSVPLVSGGKGVHVIVPLNRTQDWTEVGDFAEGMARGLAAAEPSKYLAVASKAARKGRIFIDYIRNRRTATAIAPWSLRARAEPTVAMPITWKELETLDTASAFTLRTAIARKDPWRKAFEKVTQSVPKGALDVLRKVGR